MSHQTRFPRLRAAAAIIDGIPARLFNLDIVLRNDKDPSKSNQPVCGTIGCGIGWLSLNPQMQKWGLRPGGADNGSRGVALAGKDGDVPFTTAANETLKLHSTSVAHAIFAPYGSGTWDHKLGARTNDIGDPAKGAIGHKTLLKRRIAYFLHINGESFDRNFATLPKAVL